MPAFIFDLDGTLNDSIPLIVMTAQKAYAELGLSVSEQQIKSFIGVPLLETGEHFAGPGRGEEYLQAYLRHYDPSACPMQAFPGIRTMLLQLRARGARLAVATAKRHQMALDTVAAIGLDDVLETVVDCEATERRKPYGDPALCAMQRLGVTAAESVFIGDSVHDILCGHNAGLRACAVTWGAGTLEELTAGEPEYVVNSVAELTELLLSLC